MCKALSRESEQSKEIIRLATREYVPGRSLTATQKARKHLETTKMCFSTESGVYPLKGDTKPWFKRMS